MIIKKPIILLTGHPGIGKSTVVQKIAELTKSNSGGFYTREMRAGQKRTGFEIVTLEGDIGLLATKEQNIKFTNQVLFKNYRINLDAIERVAIPALLDAIVNKKMVIIDEIGPMEIFSDKFCDTILKILDDQTIMVVGTIVKRSYKFADMVKAHSRVTLKQVTMDNRESLPFELFYSLQGSKDE